jgi:hypothetical protein
MSLSNGMVYITLSAAMMCTYFRFHYLSAKKEFITGHYGTIIKKMKKNCGGERETARRGRRRKVLGAHVLANPSIHLNTTISACCLYIIPYRCVNNLLDMFSIDLLI